MGGGGIVAVRWRVCLQGDALRGHHCGGHPVPKDPRKVAAKWATNLANSTENMKDGAEDVRESPTEAAAKKQDKYLAGVQKAVQSGKWAANLRAVSKQDWIDAYVAKAIPRIAAGATMAESTMADYQTMWLAHEEEGKRKVDAMPNNTPQERDARMTFMANWNRSFKGKWKKGRRK